MIQKYEKIEGNKKIDNCKYIEIKNKNQQNKKKIIYHFWE